MGASASNNPTNNVNCGRYPSGHDTWITLTVPASGNVTVELSNFDIPNGNINDSSLEFYTGSCGNLGIIQCTGLTWSFTQQTHIIPFSNLSPGSTLYIRGMNFNSVDEYQICAYEESFYPEACSLDLIRFISVSACDPLTNTVTATFEVSYTAPANVGPLYLDFEWLNIPLTSNPQLIQIDVPAQGQDFNFQNAYIYGGCFSNYYKHFVPFTAPAPCSTTMPAHDECVNAIEIFPSSNCSGSQEFTFLNASISPYNPPFDYTCSYTQEEDLWFTFTTTSSNDLSLYYEYVSGNFSLYFDLFTGTCNNLIPWPNTQCLSGSAYSKIPLVGLPVGQQFFIRVVPFSPNTQGNFNMCLIENCPSIIQVANPVSTDQYFYKAFDQVIGSSSIQSAANVTFQGTNSVTLLDGFTVNDQCIFLADLEGCN